MKPLELGLTDFERDMRDIERRQRNCLLAIGFVVVVASLVLAWIDV